MIQIAQGVLERWSGLPKITRLTWTLLGLVLLCIAPSMSHAVKIPGSGNLEHVASCTVRNITGAHSEAGSRYSGDGECSIVETGPNRSPRLVAKYQIQFTGRWHRSDQNHWEKIYIVEDRRRHADRPDPTPIEIWTTNVTCFLDPWQYPNPSPCRIHNAGITGTGSISFHPALTDYFNNPPEQIPPTSRLTDQQRTFLSQQYKDYLQRTGKILEQKLNASPTPYRTNLFPTILAPLAGQRFPSRTVVPIKLGAPQGMHLSSYLVRLEKKDVQGKWVSWTQLPVGQAVAGSVTGYTGFGAGVPPCCATSPGIWRISAQVSDPKSSGWSEWVEFIVMAPVTTPNSTVQRAPKMFGP